MKRISKVLLSCILLISANVAFSYQHYQAKILGLATPFASFGFLKNLKKVPGVRKVEIDYQKGMVSITYVAKSNLDEKQIAKVATQSGFKFVYLTKLDVKS